MVIVTAGADRGSVHSERDAFPRSQPARIAVPVGRTSRERCPWGSVESITGLRTARRQDTRGRYVDPAFSPREVALQA